MSCKSCKSEHGNVFNSEVALHFQGLSGQTKPIVWVFREVRVCLECGFTEFAVPPRELAVLKTGRAMKGALVLTDDTRSLRKPDQSDSGIQRARELRQQTRIAREALTQKLELLKNTIAQLQKAATS